MSSKNCSVKDIEAIIRKDDAHDVCTWCGTVILNNQYATCPNCQHDDWSKPSKEFMKNG